MPLIVSVVVELSSVVVVLVFGVIGIVGVDVFCRCRW